jgi:ribosome biogenesis protein Tsr3
MSNTGYKTTPRLRKGLHMAVMAFCDEHKTTMKRVARMGIASIYFGLRPSQAIRDKVEKLSAEPGRVKTTIWFSPDDKEILWSYGLAGGKTLATAIGEVLMTGMDVWDSPDEVLRSYM